MPVSLIGVETQQVRQVRQTLSLKNLQLDINPTTIPSRPRALQVEVLI
jgi:hypothetical protein